MVTQACSICGKNKSLSEFYVNKELKTGYEHQCKMCRKKRFRELRENANAVREYNKKTLYSLSQQELSEIVLYNPETGEIYNALNNLTVYTNDKGYKYIVIFDIDVLVHRLAYFLMTGQWPKIIDHINGNTSDNRWCNLRNLDHRGNGCNRKTHRNGRYVGAKHNKRNKWEARAVNKCGVRIHLGTYNTEREAGLAYAKYVIHNNLVPRNMFKFTDEELEL